MLWVCIVNQKYILEPNSRPFFGGVDRHHFMGQIFQNMGHLSSVSTPHKFSIDTKDDGSENLSPASNMAIFWVSM